MLQFHVYFAHWILQKNDKSISVFSGFKHTDEPCILVLAVHQLLQKEMTPAATNKHWSYRHGWEGVDAHAGKWYQDNASCHTCFIVYSHITHNLHCIHKTYIHTSYISQCLYTCYTSALITKHCSDILVLYSRFRVSWYTKHAHIFFVLTNMPSQNNVTRQVPWCQLHKFLI